jgi:hypothetical protein
MFDYDPLTFYNDNFEACCRISNDNKNGLKNTTNPSNNVSLKVLSKFTSHLLKNDNSHLTSDSLYDFDKTKNQLFPKLKYTINHDCFLNIVMTNSHYTKKQIMDKYNSLNPNTKVTIYHITVLLKFYHLSKYKLKPRPIHIFSQHYRNELLIYLQFLTYFISKEFTIIYLDETSCNRYSIKTKRFWATKNDYMKNYKYYKQKKFSFKSLQLLVASNRDGVLVYDKFHGNNNAKIYVKFIKKVYEFIVKNDIKKPLLILDNSRIHRSKLLLNEFKNLNLTVLFGVRYFCDLNYCEMMFNSLKRQLSNSRIRNRHFKWEG